MKAADILRYGETRALPKNSFSSSTGEAPFKTRVTGRGNKVSRKKSFGALSFVIAAIVAFLFLFNPANLALMPAAIMERLVETFDTQYADAVESKFSAIQMALQKGEIPKKVASILKTNNVVAGFFKNGVFTEGNSIDGNESENSDGLVLKMGDKIIKPKDFITEVHDGSGVLYKAVNEATFSRFAYYYDDAAKEVIKKYSSRNNYTSDSDFKEVMNKIMSGDNNITVNGVSVASTENEDGETEYQYTESGGATSAKSGVWDFINSITTKFTGSDKNSATINCASVVNLVDTTLKENWSKKFYLGLLENFSKMMVGEGDESKIVDVMDYLTTKDTNNFTDVTTQKETTITGTPLESPSLYAVLSDKELNPKDKELVKNFDSDRVLKMVESKLGGASGYDSITSNVASLSSNTKGTIGRLNTGSETCDTSIISSVEPILSNSLNYNSFESINGIYAGEFLVEGAANLGAELAKMSGGVSGDEDAVNQYNKLNNKILALDAKVDRMERSPFDITSKNTFLGSILYNLAFVWGGRNSSMLTRGTTFMSVANKSLAAILPTTYADGNTGYLSSFGSCETYGTIGVVGTAQCSESSTFDTSTLNNPQEDPGFISFVEQNTTLDSSGNRVPNKGSALENFIKYTKRTTPLGIIDGGILESLTNKTSSIPLISNVVGLIKNFLGASQDDLSIASGKAFVNSKSNPLWDSVYKYAQRYVSRARAIALLRQAADDENAYMDLPFFEGKDNPVIALFYNNQVAEH